MLLQQLLKLNEGRMKEAMMDVIQNAVNHAPIGNASYEKALDIIVRFAKVRDHNEVLAGSSDSELKQYVKDFFPEDEFEGVREDVNEDEESSEEEKEAKPKTISKADGFKVTFEEETDRVRIIDDAGEVLVTMPLVTWKQLCR
jgi:hypothetical protein